MIRSICLVFSLAAVTACVSVLPEKSAPDALYRLGPLEATHEISASIMVREPVASRLYAGRAIASEGKDGGMRLVRGVEWADSATRMMQAALVDSLKGEGEHVAVTATMGAPSDFELVWRVSDFTLKGETARCRLEATLLDGKSRRALAQETFATSAVAVGKQNAERAKALTEAGRACISELGSFVAAEMQTQEN